MSNPANTKVLAELFTTPADQRDAAWRERFYAAAPDAMLMAFDPQVEFGPDGFPYFQFSIPSSDQAPTASVAYALDHCLQNGFGIVIYRDAQRQGVPGWVFSYGQLLVYAMLGDFEGTREPPPEPGQEPAPASEDGSQPVLFATPSETFFPPVARKHVAEYLVRLGVTEPKVMMLVEPRQWPANGLMFNLTLAHVDGDRQLFDNAHRGLHWYLPETYCGILKMPEDWNDESFVPLVSA